MQILKTNILHSVFFKHSILARLESKREKFTTSILRGLDFVLVFILVFEMHVYACFVFILLSSQIKFMEKAR